MSKMCVKSNGDKDVLFDDQFANIVDLTSGNKWILTSLARNIAHDDVYLHSKLRRDIASLALAKAGSIGAIRLDIL